MKTKWLIIFISGALIIWFVNLFIALNEKNNSSNLWGDAFGMANSLFSFFAFAGVLYSLYIQRKEQDRQKKDIFEQVFFKMLNQLQSITNSAITTMKHPDSHPMSSFQHAVIQGNEYFSLVFNELLSELGTDRQGEIALFNNGQYPSNLLRRLLNEFPLESGDSFLSNKIVLISKYFINEPLIEDPIRPVSTEELRKYIECVYIEILKKHTDNIDHFYRYLSSLLKFVQNGEKELKVDPEFYYKLVQAQLTNAQLALLFYSSITGVARNAEGKNEFAEIIDKSNLLENLPKSHCPQKELLQFYETTKFKFIS